MFTYLYIQQNIFYKDKNNSYEQINHNNQHKPKEEEQQVFLEEMKNVKKNLKVNK